MSSVRKIKLTHYLPSVRPLPLLVSAVPRVFQWNRRFFPEICSGARRPASETTPTASRASWVTKRL